MDKALKYNVSSALLNLYCLYRQRWVCMIDPDHSPYPTQTIKHRFTDGDIMNHLDGKYCVCVFAGEHATKFLTFDVDLADAVVIHKLIDALADLGIPREYVYVSFSGRKGYHVDIFFKDFIYNNTAERLYWAAIEHSQLDPRKVEFRPTPRQAIKLPLGVHQATHRSICAAFIPTFQKRLSRSRSKRCLPGLLSAARGHGISCRPRLPQGQGWMATTTTISCASRWSGIVRRIKRLSGPAKRRCLRMPNSLRHGR